MLSKKSHKSPPASFFGGSNFLRPPPARQPRLVRVPRGSGGRPGPPSERAGAIRFLRAVPVVVAVLLRRQCGAFVPAVRSAMRAAAVFVRRPRDVAAV